MVLDNLRAHKVKGVRARSRRPARGCSACLPYSPERNPIEPAFAKLKTLLRTAAARTVEALWHTIGRLLAAFSAAGCPNYLAHAGYAPSNREVL